MAEDRKLFLPSREIVDAAHVPDYDSLRAEAAEDPIAFWEARARELLDWYAPWKTVLDESEAPF
ncbi:MAG: acetyl-coenzyme A synthetase N-terminal domain-containing protein, partial [Longimicrobiales bacterium]